MSRDEIVSNIGQLCRVTGHGDLAMDGALRGAIYAAEPGVIVRLTKGGLALVRFAGKEYAVPPRNVVPVPMGG